MTRIIFHDNCLCERGSSLAIFDYAHYNQKILKNKSIVSYNAKDHRNVASVIQKFKDADIELAPHQANFNEFGEISRSCADIAYIFKGGGWDGQLVSGMKNAIHCTFQFNQPHGDVYAYVSEWLSKVMSNGERPWVPHIVQMPKPQKCMRDQLGIPKDAIVFGRYGGYEQFDIPFVKQTIKTVLNLKKNYWFVFVNTEPFVQHERVIYLDKIINLQDKSDYINSCDAMIHARDGGESFGLAICEFMFHNKPVLAANFGHDKNHIEILAKYGTLYDNNADLTVKMLNIDRYFDKNYTQEIFENYSPEVVMQRFEKVFIK